MAVEVTLEPTFSAGIPEVLFDPGERDLVGQQHDVTPDGSRFLVNQAIEEPGGEALPLLRAGASAIEPPGRCGASVESSPAPMDDQPNQPAVVLVESRLDPAQLRRLVAAHFEDMVKYVVDLQRGVAAVGGELHADEEAVLLEQGSSQDDLWGANYYPGKGETDCIEYTSLINIRPARGNRSMVIEDEGVRARIREITFDLIGRGEPLE